MQQTLNLEQNQPLHKTSVSSSFFYTIRDTECNSKVFGACEICGKDAVQVFHQNKLKTTFIPQLNRDVTIQVSDGYGHYNCLLTVRS
jgi:hypothetical protein